MNAISISEQAFNVLREDLIKVRPDFSNKDVILCPICLREIKKENVIKFGIEHIIPQVVVTQDSDEHKSLGSKNQRCGITVLCRQTRNIKSNGIVSKDGCNGFKGKTYDWALKRVLDNSTHTQNELEFKHRVSLLIIAYLGAFQYLGYSYILRKEFDEIRKQFDFPEKQVTNWIDSVYYFLEPKSYEIIATSIGHPFILGFRKSMPLEVYFRRSKVLLPLADLNSLEGVKSLETLIPEN